MPRKPRFNLIGIPQHVIQRGNNREPCFYAEQDFRHYFDKDYRHDVIMSVFYDIIIPNSNYKKKTLEKKLKKGKVEIVFGHVGPSGKQTLIDPMTYAVLLGQAEL